MTRRGPEVLLGFPLEIPPSYSLARMVEVYDENGQAAVNDPPKETEMKPCSGHHFANSAAGWRPASHSHHCLALVFVFGPRVIQPIQIYCRHQKSILIMVLHLLTPSFCFGVFRYTRGQEAVVLKQNRRQSRVMRYGCHQAMLLMQMAAHAPCFYSV